MEESSGLEEYTKFLIGSYALKLKFWHAYRCEHANMSYWRHRMKQAELDALVPDDRR